MLAPLLEDEAAHVGTDAGVERQEVCEQAEAEPDQQDDQRPFFLSPFCSCCCLDTVAATGAIGSL